MIIRLLNLLVLFSAWDKKKSNRPGREKQPAYLHPQSYFTRVSKSSNDACAVEIANNNG